MHPKAVLLMVAVIFAAVVPLASAQQEDVVHHSDYVVIPHMKGSLALQVSSIAGLWYLPAGDDKASQLRVLSPVLADAKTLTGADAETLWTSIRARGEEFVFVAHMGGNLAIPRAQIRTAYYSVDSGAPRLRLVYDGDPNGKTIDGDEATKVWNEIQR